MLSKSLKRLRSRMEMTQQQVADKIGVTRPAYTAYEKGNRTPDTETLGKLADLFDVSLDELVGRDRAKDHFSEAEAIMFKDIEGFDELPIEKQEEIRRTINEQIEFLVHKQKRDS